MATQHVNFYENLKEARMRIDQTVVLYDGEPHYVLCISDHKNDGIFRVYLDPLGKPEGMACHRYDIPYSFMDTGTKKVGHVMDEFMEASPESGVLRKTMNSPKFGKFRPFPLGMCNHNGHSMYIQRQPTRYTQQGLTSSMLNQTPVNLYKNSIGGGIDIFSPSFYHTIKGLYPTAQECLENLKDEDVTNTSVAFHRDFAFLRGPLDVMFLAYRQEVIGLLPHGDLTLLNLGSKFKYTKEVLESLELFETINS